MPESHRERAVPMLGFGGPETSEDVRPFIANVVRGRNVPDERIATVVDQYATIGGRSPFNELTCAQALSDLAREKIESFHAKPERK